MIDSINQVKTNRKLSSQILCLLSLPSLPCLKLMLNLDFLPHTSFGVLWTTLDKSSWLPLAKICPLLFYQKTTPLCGHSSCASSQETHAWAFHLAQCETGNFEKGTKQNVTKEKLLKSPKAALLSLNCGLASYWFPSSFLSQFFRSSHTLDRQSKVLTERKITLISQLN